MGFFEKIFGTKKETPKQAGAEIFRFLRGYTPVFTDFGGEVYESDMIRAALDAHGRHAQKLQPNIQGSAKPNLQNRLRIQPNAWQTWPAFLYRHVTILYARNTVFTVPVRGQYDEINGIIDIVPEKWELVDYQGEPWLRFYFDRGKRSAVSLWECGIQTRFQYKNELFGENNQALQSVLDLIELQKQGEKEGIRNGATFRFYATHNNFVQDKDLEKERKRFDEMNFRSDTGGGGLLLFPNTYKDIKQIEVKPWVVDADQMKVINKAVYEYFGVNEDILTNKAYGDAWSAFYEGAIEPFAIQFSEVMTKMFFTLREQSTGNMVMATANRMQYLSNQDKLNVSAQLLDRGIMSINDAREIWNLPPVDGGDTRIIRGEYYSADEKVTEQDNGE